MSEYEAWVRSGGPPDMNLELFDRLARASRELNKEKRMRTMMNLWRNEEGQDLVEYTLLMAAMALATGAVLIPMRNEVSGIWSGTCSVLGVAKTGGS